jgi:hypothetical protein
LLHSRLVLIAGLLCLWGEAASRSGDSREFVRRQLGLTPLERVVSSLAHCVAARDEWVPEIVARYDTFLSRMADPAFVDRLTDDTDDSPRTPEIEELTENGRRLKTALTRAIAARATQWPASYRESLML